MVRFSLPLVILSITMDATSTVSQLDLNERRIARNGKAEGLNSAEQPVNTESSRAQRMHVSTVSKLGVPSVATPLDDRLVGYTLTQQQLEDELRNAFEGSPEAQHLCDYRLMQSVRRPIRWILLFMGCDANLDAGTIGEPKMIDATAYILDDVLQKYMRRLLLGRGLQSSSYGPWRSGYKFPLSKTEKKIIRMTDWIWHRVIEQPLYLDTWHVQFAHEDDM